MNRSESGDAFMLLLGTLFGAGYLPKAPGTWGSLFFLPIIFFSYQQLGTAGLILLTIISSLVSLAAAPAAIRKLGPDPGEFVLDECAGQALVFTVVLLFFSWISLSITILLCGFILFRLFDITKPLGIKRIEKFRGKYGILIDDLLAGLYASMSLMALIYIFSRFQ